MYWSVYPGHRGGQGVSSKQEVPGGTTRLALKLKAPLGCFYMSVGRVVDFVKILKILQKTEYKSWTDFSDFVHFLQMALVYFCKKSAKNDDPEIVL